MKKLIVTFLMVFLTIQLWAIELPKQGFGVQIGWAQPILRLNSPSTTMPKDSLVDVTRLHGFKIGVVYDGSFIAGFGTSIGINYTFAGGHTNWGKASSVQPAEYPRSRSFTTYHEVELFVDWQYKFEVAKETYLMLYTGPTIQCGIAYNTRSDKQNLPGGEVESTTKNRYILHNPDASAYDAYLSNNDLKRLNVTWGIGAGFQYKRYFLRGGYDFGLIDPYNNQQFYNVAGQTYDRYTRGRLDQWTIKVGIYIWYAD